MRGVSFLLFFPVLLLAYSVSVAPKDARWADIIIKGTECEVEIWQGEHHFAKGVLKSTSGSVQKMAIIIRNRSANGDITVETDCEIVNIDFSDNAVGKPVKSVRNRALWEWKIVRD